jgi:hypothetical protein
MTLDNSWQKYASWQMSASWQMYANWQMARWRRRTA